VLERNRWFLPVKNIWIVDFNSMCFILTGSSLVITPRHKSLRPSMLVRISSPTCDCRRPEHSPPSSLIHQPEVPAASLRNHRPLDSSASTPCSRGRVAAVSTIHYPVGGRHLASERPEPFKGWENKPLLAGRGLECRRAAAARARPTLCPRPVPYASPAPPSCQSTPSRCAVYQGPAPSVHAAIAGPDMQRRGVAFGGGGGDRDELDARAAPRRRPCASPVPRHHPLTRAMRRQGPGHRRRRQRQWKRRDEG